MTRRVEGELTARGLHVGLAVASWNQAITDRLLEGALRRLEELEAGDVTVLRVPGALELPLACRALAEQECQAVVAIGAVVKGETDHYEIVVRESSSGIAQVALARGIPVANAILAAHDYEQALDRAGPGDDNKGVEGVEAAVTTARALRNLAGDG